MSEVAISEQDQSIIKAWRIVRASYDQPGADPEARHRFIYSDAGVALRVIDLLEHAMVSKTENSRFDPLEFGFRNAASGYLDEGTRVGLVYRIDGWKLWKVLNMPDHRACRIYSVVPSHDDTLQYDGSWPSDAVGARTLFHLLGMEVK
jgi:hypothetical protein